ncbi:hypothetical protein HRR83_004888 [Exophiala dermatitidis]|uniref:Nucleoporin Nup159/Nup146 N-terminal domain-containing protein n=1 Tax=Exophiala dermatitidis TaxID=5970 RepID=A0AAN6EUL4_EXODE|nr:hypothetical protein HRR74_004947 [Exophiala dermatitidis]KAJ4519625.1 hypothetical protein HRR73_003685 [Exophiala dermatitidis]KAJ4534575.1 hypothetical protein HRR76_006497 [Exophiala dermatitidis]KAJ4551078.1 hypothetical protein HRR77_003423 [Exophiala dermatitidis]KAJ4560952.1 hypothetical protein HRR79_007514 [Exophiala dermatitidis]
MAFSFSNMASSTPGFGAATISTQQGVNVKDGDELKEIQTNELGFAALNGEAKVRLLPTPWPSDNLPPPSSSLLAIASVKGLLAAAGPDALYITATSKVRDGFRSPAPSSDETIRPFTPELKIAVPRVSHVVFSADESVLVVATEKGGEILAYQVNQIQQGQSEPAARISTNGQSLRALVPNPVPESAHLFALITSNGDLMMLDLKSGSMVSGSNGAVFKSGASCLSWSNRGKQLVAGLADGTAIQVRPDGALFAEIPKSTSVPAGMHVSGISWLENDTFFIIYTPNDTSDGIPPSEYYIVNREPKTTNYTFQKLPEVLPPFGVERLPSSHFISRLRNFPPHLQDLLIVSATTSTDVGLISKTDKPLSQEEPVTSAFTFTTIEDDTRRAQLPLSSDMQDTSPIGMALDLSSQEKVPNPIPADAEILETAGPVPGLVILNNEGILVAWWVIYNDSVREKTTFPGLAAVQDTTKPAAPVSQSASPSPALSNNAFGQNSNPSPFAKPAMSGFGVPGAPAFGTSSPIGASKPSWATSGFGSAANPATNGPAFGSASTIGGGSTTPAFGSASALGSRPTPFGQSSAPGSQPAFGQPSAFGASSTTSPFASAATKPGDSGFASFSKSGGFSSFAGNKPDQPPQSPFAAAASKPSVFGQSSSGKMDQPAQSPFAAAAASVPSVFGQSSSGKTDQPAQSPFAAASGPNVFGQSSASTFGKAQPTTSPFASAKPADGKNIFGNTGSFKLQSSFQGDGSAKDDLKAPKESGGFGFGGSLDDMLKGPQSTLSATHDKEAEMDEEGEASEADSDKTQDARQTEPAPQSAPKVPQTLVTPPSTLTQSKTTPAPPVSSLFGRASTTPQPQTTTPGWSFGGMASTTPKETPDPSHMTLFGTRTAKDETPAAVQKSEPVSTFGALSETPKIKEEPPSDNESVNLKNIPEAPLPPDPVSKPGYTTADTPASSTLSKSPPDDAPLPPDFVPSRSAGHDEQPVQQLPSDDEGEHEEEGEEDEVDDFSSDVEESGDEITEDDHQEEDVTEEQHEELQTSPESSFKSGKVTTETSPTGGLFTKVSSRGISQKPSRPLFGEVGAGPVFAPPKPHESPRSPSPVRNIPAERLRLEPSRSVSAPAHPQSIIDQRKAEYQKSSLAVEAAKARTEEVAKEQARREGIARQKAQAEAEQLEPLEDDEDELLRQELERPVSPNQSLGDFVTYQPKPAEDIRKSGIPAQIERLYSDINSMVYTLGINARSLSAFMLYQQPEATNESWPSVLKSDTPMDALNDEWFLNDISRLHEGQAVLSELLTENNIEDYAEKIQQCQTLLGHDLFELRTKLTALRKTIHALTSNDTAVAAPLSAEQSSIQHDLRKAFNSVQTKLVEMQDAITILRAKITQNVPADKSGRRSSVLSRTSSQKKPTVEAVTKTVNKMLSMAEQKSADVDVLEAQLKRLDLSMASSMLSDGNGSNGQPAVATPQRSANSTNGATPGSTRSIYHTPDSKFGSSTRSRASLRVSQNGGLALLSAEDKERWQAQARRRKEAASVLKDVLREKRKKGANKK